MLYWHQCDSLHFGPQSTPTLYFDGKKVVKSLIGSLVATTLDQAKAGGLTKATAGFAGVSKKNILQVTNNVAKYCIHNVKFTMDIFSRYLWLWPLEKSQVNMLVGHFRGFIVSTVPQITFKVTEEKNLMGRLDLFAKIKIKLIKSRPYHLQSQGKVERLLR